LNKREEPLLLTRLEVDGFKNLVEFAIDFGPFTCIAGPNGVGKSNVFDAIRFMSLLADHTLVEAAMMVRGGDIETSDIQDLFWAQGTERASKFRIMVEMIVGRDVLDDFGRPAEATSTFLRYEVVIGYEKAAHRGMLERLVLLSESLDYITEGESSTHLKFPHSPKQFRSAAVRNSRKSQAGYISTREAQDGKTEIVVHQDGGSRGQGQTAPAATAPRTIVATSNTSATPTILAARREMQQWRFLALEPSAMRKPDRFQADPHIREDGGHVPATLNRLVAESEQHGASQEDVFATIASRVARLVPITNVSVSVDEVRKLLTLVVRESSGVRLPAASLSDGTLRFLTLAIIASDPTATGLLCIEEPENGIHPGKIAQMVELLQDLALDAFEMPGRDNPFRQVIVATHSPAFVQLQVQKDLLFAIEARVKGTGEPIRTLRCRPLQGTWRAKHEEQSVGIATIIDYLEPPQNAQLVLPQLDLPTATGSAR
jgi:predicted ATPase